MIPLFTVVLALSTQAATLSQKDVTASVLRHLPLLEEARLKAEASDAMVTSSEGAFDTKLKAKHRNHIEKRYDNEFTEVALEKPLQWSGLSLYAGHRRGTGLFAPYEGKFDTSAAGEVFAGLSFPLLRGRSIDEARLDLAARSFERQQALSELKIKKNFYVHKSLSLYQKWRLQHRKIQIIEGLLKIAEERQAMLEKRHKAGDLERIKLRDNQRSLNKRQEELLKAKMALKKAALDLSLYYRDSEGSPVDVSSMVPSTLSEEFKRPELLPASLPQLRLLELEWERNRQEESFARNLKLPSLDLDIQTARELSGDYPYDPQKVYLLVSLEFPLENRKGEGKTVATVYKGLALQKRKEWLEGEFRTAYRQALELSELSESRLKILEAELENSQVVAEAERKRWRSGDSDLFVVALREQEAADVEVKLWTAKLDLEQYRLDLGLYTATLAE